MGRRYLRLADRCDEHYLQAMTCDGCKHHQPDDFPSCGLLGIMQLADDLATKHPFEMPHIATLIVEHPELADRAAVQQILRAADALDEDPLQLARQFRDAAVALGVDLTRYTSSHDDSPPAAPNPLVSELLLKRRKG